MSDDNCVGLISYCDNSAEGSVGAKIVGKFSNTLASAAGECRIVAWFGPLMAVLVSSMQILLLL